MFTFITKKFVVNLVNIKHAAVCEKTAGLRSGNSSDLSSACLKVLVPVEIFQFSDMHYETERYRDSTDGLL